MREVKCREWMCPEYNQLQDNGCFYWSEENLIKCDRYQAAINKFNDSKPALLIEIKEFLEDVNSQNGILVVAVPKIACIEMIDKINKVLGNREK